MKPINCTLTQLIHAIEANDHPPTTLPATVEKTVKTLGLVALGSRILHLDMENGHRLVIRVEEIK